MGMNEKVLKLKYALMNVGVTCDNNMDAVLDAAEKYVRGVVEVPEVVVPVVFDEPEMPTTPAPNAKPKRAAKKK